jgi:hypothetical protein
MPYFVMACNGEYPSAALAKRPKLDSPPWFFGHKVPNPPVETLVYQTDPKRSGNLKMMYAAEDFPVMRDDLVEALRAVGVDNLETFPAVIRDVTTGIDHTNYKAFNIIGVAAVADMGKSVTMPHSESNLIDVAFESLAIDESRANGLLLFRLAEAVSAIIVSEVIKQEVERRDLPGMMFYEPADWSG